MPHLLPVDHDAVGRAEVDDIDLEGGVAAGDANLGILREIPGSLIRRSASLPRPITRPGGRSGCRVPLTSSTSLARRMVVSPAGPLRSVIPATASEVTVKRPVGRPVSNSKLILIGPLKT